MKKQRLQFVKVRNYRELDYFEKLLRTKPYNDWEEGRVDSYGNSVMEVSMIFPMGRKPHFIAWFGSQELYQKALEMLKFFKTEGEENRAKM